MANEAAWLKEPQTNVEVGPAKMHSPGPGEVLVKVESIGFNVIDAKIQKFSAIPMSYPGILGLSFGGTVEAAGPLVTAVTSGDRVVVKKPHRGDDSYSAFQKYALALESCLAKLDPSTSFDEASVAVANLAATPVSGKAKRNGEKVLIYGGSSSCGRYAVKYASDAGYEIVTTSSPDQRGTVKKHNPAYIIDHTLPPDRLVDELKSHGPYDAVFDAIGTPPVTAVLVAMFGDKGGSYHTTLPLMGSEQMPTNVERVFVSYPPLLEEDENEELRQWFWEEYLPKGLKNGQIIPSSIVKKEKGLEGIQGVLDTILSVAGKRFVVNPQA